jgi:two-component system nitrate/nitrite sensor histidine kinase NarX
MASGDAPDIQEALVEIENGIRESSGDVRELLMHFRTRADHDDIESALRVTLSKFEHQTGVPTDLQSTGTKGLPIPADAQIQVLHVVQEALSNVRKHAVATHVRLHVQQSPVWQFEVQDDGAGFMPPPGGHDETHVGQRIMHERAARIGASLQVQSTPGHGTRVVLTLPRLDQTLAPPITVSPEALLTA